MEEIDFNLNLNKILYPDFEYCFKDAETLADFDKNILLGTLLDIINESIICQELQPSILLQTNNKDIIFNHTMRIVTPYQNFSGTANHKTEIQFDFVFKEDTIDKLFCYIQGVTPKFKGIRKGLIFSREAFLSINLTECYNLIKPEIIKLTNNANYCENNEINLAMQWHSFNPDKNIWRVFIKE